MFSCCFPKQTDVVHFGDKGLSDLVLIVANHKFYVHKMILANNSDYFKKLFYEGMDGLLTYKFQIRDAKVATIHRMLEFLYTGEMSDADSFMSCCKASKPLTFDSSKKFWEETRDLLATAKRFQISAAITKYVETMISKDACMVGCLKCFDGYMFALAYDLDVIQKYKKYDLDTVKQWCEYLSSHIPSNKQLTTNLLQDILKYVDDECSK